jgi:hypothetical protein
MKHLNHYDYDFNNFSTKRIYDLVWQDKTIIGLKYKMIINLMVLEEIFLLSIVFFCVFEFTSILLVVSIKRISFLIFTKKKIRVLQWNSSNFDLFSIVFQYFNRTKKNLEKDCNYDILQWMEESMNFFFRKFYLIVNTFMTFCLLN